MSRRALIFLAMLGSFALFAGALSFQYFGGLAPCHLCLLQRWPHRVAILFGLLGLAMPNVLVQRLLALAGGATMVVSTGMGLYHTGVERHWWEGPTACTSGSISGLQTDDLLNQIMNTGPAKCDEIVWELAGLSMANWNMLFSAMLAVVWIIAARRKTA